MVAVGLAGHARSVVLIRHIVRLACSGVRACGWRSRQWGLVLLILRGNALLGRAAMGDSAFT